MRKNVYVIYNTRMRAEVIQKMAVTRQLCTQTVSSSALSSADLLAARPADWTRGASRDKAEGPPARLAAWCACERGEVLIS